MYVPFSFMQRAPLEHQPRQFVRQARAPRAPRTPSSAPCVFDVRRSVSVFSPSLSNRISPSFFGELMLNSSPDSS